MAVEEFRNAPVRAEYADALLALKPVLCNLPPKIVVIDGPCGSGKTTLGRFLAWRFNITLIETDLCMHRDTCDFTYRNSDLDAVIEHRMKSCLPVILEGVFALRLLQKLGRKHAFHIHLICNEAEGTSVTESQWAKYENEFRPMQNADLPLELPAL